MDCIIWFVQELPKYLRGYHLCDCDEAARLAALILKAKHGDDKTALQSLPQSIPEVVPRDLNKQQTTNEWKRVRKQKNCGQPIISVTPVDHERLHGKRDTVDT